MRKGISILALCTVGLLNSCKTSETVLSPTEYVRYLESPENDFKRVVKAGQQQYTIQLATPEYMTVREFSRELNDLDAGMFSKRLQELRGHIFFLIRIQDNNGSESVTQELMKKPMQSKW